MKSDNFLIKPVIKSIIPYLIWGLILLPVLGIGLFIIVYGLYFFFRTQYQIENERILIINPFSQKIIKINKIKDSSVQNTWYGTQNLIIIEFKRYKLTGIKDASIILEILRVITDRFKKIQTDKLEYRPPQLPVTNDKMNDLIGLWQQGLISNEDFDVEKHKFS